MKFKDDFIFGGATAAYQCEEVSQIMEKERMSGTYS